MKTPFLIGSHIYLRPVLREDVPLLMKWINDPNVRQFLGRNIPAMEQDEEDFLERIYKTKENIVLIICLKEDDIPIGTMGIHNLNLRDQIATTGAAIGESDYWNHGYGTEAKMLLLHYAFTELNLRKITSNVIAFNKRSQAYLAKTGYVVIGTHKKDVYRKGRYHDLLILEVWKKDFMKIWREYKKKHLS